MRPGVTYRPFATKKGSPVAPSTSPTSTIRPSRTRMSPERSPSASTIVAPLIRRPATSDPGAGRTKPAKSLRNTWERKGPPRRRAVSGKPGPGRSGSGLKKALDGGRADPARSAREEGEPGAARVLIAAVVPRGHDPPHDVDH